MFAPFPPAGRGQYPDLGNLPGSVRDWRGESPGLHQAPLYAAASHHQEDEERRREVAATEGESGLGEALILNPLFYL